MQARVARRVEHADLAQSGVACLPAPSRVAGARAPSGTEASTTVKPFRPAGQEIRRVACGGGGGTGSVSGGGCSSSGKGHARCGLGRGGSRRSGAVPVRISSVCAVVAAMNVNPSSSRVAAIATAATAVSTRDDERDEDGPDPVARVPGRGAAGGGRERVPRRGLAREPQAALEAVLLEALVRRPAARALAGREHVSVAAPGRCGRRRHQVAVDEGASWRPQFGAEVRAPEERRAALAARDRRLAGVEEHVELAEVLLDRRDLGAELDQQALAERVRRYISSTTPPRSRIRSSRTWRRLRRSRRRSAASGAARRRGRGPAGGSGGGCSSPDVRLKRRRSGRAIAGEPSASGGGPRGRLAAVSADAWAWDETLYAGSAAYYARGRLPYPAELAEALRDELALDGTGRLLDVGCGPGSLSLLLAPLFAEVVGVDADAGMVAEAGRQAQRRGSGNASWVQLQAEDLPVPWGRSAWRRSRSRSTGWIARGSRRPSARCSSRAAPGCTWAPPPIAASRAATSCHGSVASARANHRPRPGLSGARATGRPRSA